MGNAMASCCLTNEGSHVKVIHWERRTRTLTKKIWIAGEIMMEFPDCMVCDAECFFIGHPIPALTIDDQLQPGHTYLVLPLDIFSSNTFSASCVSALVSYTPKRAPINVKECPFKYIKGSNGKVLIKVSTEFMVRIITRRAGLSDQDNENTSTGDVANGFLCSTPELKKLYEQLVGSKDQTWSPKLETISEHNKIRYSPCRFIGLQGKEKEGGSIIAIATKK